MRKETEEKLYDVRLIQRNIYKGRLTAKDLEKHIQGLENSESNSEPIQLDVEEEENSAESQEMGHPSEIENHHHDSPDDDITL